MSLATSKYHDATLSVDERVADLIDQMSTTEKAAQLGSAWVFQLAAGTDLTDGGLEILEHGLGQVTRVSGASNVSSADAARVTNNIQRFAVEHTRLGIPVVVHEEVCAGLMARGATVFPQPIGLGSTWDPELVEQMATVVSTEMRAIGAHQGLSPVLDVCRDPRWGRIEETFGEDPHLVALMGNAFVRGLQQDSLEDGVVATAKHFVGYGASQGGLNWAPALIPPRELKEVYLHPFEAAVRVAGLRSVMNGYHELDGMPCGASHELLTKILRDDWGFDGYVVADYFAVRQLESYHQLAADSTEAAATALAAGLDVELPMTDCYGQTLVEAVDAGTISADLLDTSVERVLRTKFELGLFENPYVDVEAAPSIIGSVQSRQLAQAIAAQSMVLLSNDGTLPLDPSAPTSIAVIGPNADSARNLFGDYSYAAHVETLLEMRDSSNVFEVPLPDDLNLDTDIVGDRTVLKAISETFPAATIGYAAGCGVRSEDRSGFDEAVQLASKSDIVVLVVGDESGLTDGATCGESRDRSSLDLPGIQEELAQAILDTGTPVVLVLVVGRPCGSEYLHQNCAAVLAAWLPGDEGATAIAESLAGITNPGGKLPVSVPRTAGHIPVYYRQKLSGGRSHWKGDYADSPVSPLYSFGHGLSYTSFEVSPSAPTPTTVGTEGEVVVDIVVANTGQVDGDEVVQLYIRDPRASLTRPVLELKAFARVSVPAGESRSVTIKLSPKQLGFYDQDLRYIVEPGEIEVHVGTAVDRLELAGTFAIDTGNGAVEVSKVFDAQVSISRQ